MSEHSCVSAGGEEGSPETPATDRPAAKPSHVTWLGYVIPISIVLVASLAIFVGYRAERHAGYAGESDQGAISASINEERLYSDSLLQAQAAQTLYGQWLTLSQAGLEGANPWCEYSPSAVPDPALTQIVLSCELARTVQAADQPGYAQSGSFDISQYADDLQLANGFLVDIDNQTYLAAANQDRVAEGRMLAIGVTLSLALGLCTVAQLAYRRQWLAPHRYFSLWVAIPGWLISLVCVALVVTWGA